MSKTMQAKFAGTCVTCKGRIAVGQTIRFTPGQGAECASCAGLAASPATFKCQGCGRGHGAPQSVTVEVSRYHSIGAGAVKTGATRQTLWCATCVRSQNAERVAEYRAELAEVRSPVAIAKWAERIALIERNMGLLDPERNASAR